MTCYRMTINGRPEFVCDNSDEARQWDRYSDERGGHGNAEFGDHVLDGASEAGAGAVKAGKGLIGFLPNLLMYNLLGVDKDFWDPTLSFSDIGKGWGNSTDFNFQTNPLLRPFDSLARAVYGTADTVTGHLPYTFFNEALGLDVPYLAPPPGTMEDATAEATSLSTVTGGK